VTVVERREVTIMQKTEVLKQKKGVSLNPKQSEAELACAEDDARRRIKKGFVQFAAARSLADRGGNVTIVNWAQAVTTVLAHQMEDVFGRVVISTPDTVTQFVALKGEYLASAPVQDAHDRIMATIPALVTGNTTLYQLVLLIVERVQQSLLDAIAESLTGLKWPAMLQRMQLQASTAALTAKIGGPTDTARGLWRAHFNAHKAVYTAASLATDGGKRMLVKGLVDCLEPELLKIVPGTENHRQQSRRDHLRGGGKGRAQCNEEASSAHGDERDHGQPIPGQLLPMREGGAQEGRLPQRRQGAGEGQARRAEQEPRPGRTAGRGGAVRDLRGVQRPLHAQVPGPDVPELRRQGPRDGRLQAGRKEGRE
jgi:hypothetical protein